MSLIIAEKGLRHLRKKYNEKGPNMHAVYIEVSDNSPKEFRCVGYLHGLAQLAKKFGVFILKMFSTPQHGKDKSDSEGSVIKGSIRAGLAAEKIVWTERKTYSSAVIKHCKKHFKKIEGGPTRNFYEISKSKVKHRKSDTKALKGFKQYTCFLLDPGEDTKCYYRELGCCCARCLNGDFLTCLEGEICGEWKTWNFEKAPLRLRRPAVERMDVDDDTELKSNEDDEDGEVYCICRRGQENRWMIECSQCSQWFHGECVGIDKKDKEWGNEDYYCELCLEWGIVET